ncbi:MAG TPA: hypothetical protein VM940_15125 [Chthoniobacterales bacterium]|jgi:hypothetical protein|nr:hypothetical protein [Chthoniobacterales bacterium]
MLKRISWGVFLVLTFATLGVSQSIPKRGATSSVELKKQLEQFNNDVAAWNKRCKVTKTDAEEAWCKKERARIDARRAELVASGALPK